MFRKVDWTWLIVGLLIGFVLWHGCTNPKSPLSSTFSFYYGSDMK